MEQAYRAERELQKEIAYLKTEVIPQMQADTGEKADSWEAKRKELQCSIRALESSLEVSLQNLSIKDTAISSLEHNLAVYQSLTLHLESSLRQSLAVDGGTSPSS